MIDDDTRAERIVSVSHAVTSASLTVIGAAVALTTYIATNYERLAGFYVCVVASVVALLFGVIQGWRGITSLALDSSRGLLDVSTFQPFNRQSLAFLLGVVVLVGGTVYGLSRPRRASQAESSVPQLARDDGSLRLRMMQMTSELQKLSTQERVLSHRLILLEHRR